jgi:hypothetical protein
MVGDDGEFIAEPVGGRRAPAISAGSAMRHFERLYGATTRAQDRNMSVRYGLITMATGGEASDNAIGFAPFLRHFPAWLITNCVNPSSPKGIGPHHVGGTMFAVIADTHSPKYWGFDWRPARPTLHDPGATVLPGTNIQHPNPNLTPFYSTPWRVAARSRHGAILLRYRTRRCYTFDHLYTEIIGHTYHVSVILSTGPHHRCEKPSAISPYMSLTPTVGVPIKVLRHLKTGKIKFDPESS